VTAQLPLSIASFLQPTGSQAEAHADTLPTGGPQVPPSLPAEHGAALFLDLFSVLVDTGGKPGNPSPSSPTLPSDDPSGNGGPSVSELPAPVLSAVFPAVLNLEVVRSMHLLNMPGGISGPGKKKEAASQTGTAMSGPVPALNQGGKDPALPLIWNSVTLMPSVAPSQPVAADGSAPPPVAAPVWPDVPGPARPFRNRYGAAAPESKPAPAWALPVAKQPLPLKEMAATASASDRATVGRANMPASSEDQGVALPQTVPAIRPEIRFYPEATPAATNLVPGNLEAAPAVPADAHADADSKNPLPPLEPVKSSRWVAGDDLRSASSVIAPAGSAIPVQSPSAASLITPPAGFSAGADDPTAPVPPAPAPTGPPRERPDIADANPAAGWEDSQPNLAFVARLVPLPPRDVAPLAGPPRPEPSVTAAKPGSDAPPSSVPAPPHPETGARPISRNAEPERARKTADLATPAVLKTTNPELQPVNSSPDNSQPAERAAAPEPGPPPVRTEIQSLAEPAPAAGAARDIQFQVNQGGQRVDVRLTERGGEVHVSVRTPDAQLAGSLREDLPVLSAKLEQRGFRAETWRPAMSTPPLHSGAEETGLSNTPHDGQNPPPRQGGQEHQQAPPRRPKQSLAESSTTSQRKYFSWHISQLP